MGKFISMNGSGYADLEETSELGKLWAKQSKKKATAKPKRPRGRPRKVRADFAVPFLMTDIKPFVSPIDGTEITSRSKLRAHEQKHGVKQNGDMKPGEIVAKENKRIAETKRLAEPETVKWI